MTTPTPPWRSTRAPGTARPDGPPAHRPSPVRPLARVVRGVVAGVLSTALAGASHVAVDPAAPDPVAVAAAVAAAVGVCVLLAGHRMGPVRLGAAVALSQGSYHLLFSLPHGSTAGAHAGQRADLAAAHPHPPPGALFPDLPSAGTIHWPMLLMHLLAVVVTYLLLRHGERAWWSLVDALGALARRVLAPVVPRITAPRPLRRSHRPLPHDLQDLGHALRIITPRGPPVPLS